MGYFSKRWGLACVLLLLWLGCSSCALPQVSAEERLFLPLTVDLLDEYILPSADYEGTQVGGLSAIAYDQHLNQFYALSDDRGSTAPPRFHTLSMDVTDDPNDLIGIVSMDIDGVTFLSTEDGTPYVPGTLDPEGLVLSPQGTLFIASEGVAQDGIAPTVDEFDLQSGQRLRRLPIPSQYIPRSASETVAENDQVPLIDLNSVSQLRETDLGVQNNRGFESLALNSSGMGAGNDEPFRVFAAIEEPLQQDVNRVDATNPQPARLLHYVVSPDQAFILSEHVYCIDPPPFGAVNNGLVELLSLDPGGHFLSLERSYGLGGVRAKLFQVVFSNATDTLTRMSLPSGLQGIQPVRKRLVLDFYDLGIGLDNLEGMTLGPRLPDGSPSLLLISDNNFNTQDQVTQVLLFRLNGLQ